MRFAVRCALSAAILIGAILGAKVVIVIVGSLIFSEQISSGRGLDEDATRLWSLSARVIEAIVVGAVIRFRVHADRWFVPVVAYVFVRVIEEFVVSVVFRMNVVQPWWEGITALVFAMLAWWIVGRARVGRNACGSDA